MRDIWAFLLQTLTVSGAAAVLLLVKRIFRDKLSPRWQFAVWGVLGLVLLVPAGYGGRYVLFDWPVLVETVKGLCTGRHDLTAVTAPVPLLPKAGPETLFDWLFLVYMAGVVLLLCRYLISYLRLRRLLAQSSPVCGEMLEKIKKAEEVYSLKTCQAVEVPGLGSAFVCGLVRPVLALPAGRDVDEKVLLHELVHRKQRDVLWGLVIGLFRCIHWCNPLLWYCADRAGNDLEARCDQRVLEKLEGEARRDYGRILLDMTNEKYARAPGTSSAANGGRNIRRRIEAIARFKRYPRGMGLVSVCVAVMLAASLLPGSTVRAVQPPYLYAGREGAGMELELARARTNRCGTLAGALDTYAKAVLNRSVTDRIMCAPTACQEKLARLAGQSHYWDCGYPGIPQVENGYCLYGMKPVGEDAYETILVLSHSWVDSESHRQVRPVVQTLRAQQEGDRWIVKPLDDFRELDTEAGNLAQACWELGIPAVTRYVGEEKDFRVEVLRQNVYLVDNAVSNDGGFFTSGVTFESRPKPNAAFDRVECSYQGTVTCLGTPEERASITAVAVGYGGISGDRAPRFPDRVTMDRYGDFEYDRSEELSWSFRTLEPGWGPDAVTFGGGSSTAYDEADPEPLPDRYAAAIYLNDGDKYVELTLDREEMVK